jgi:polar amino acid transport system substrate-binding protein
MRWTSTLKMAAIGALAVAWAFSAAAPAQAQPAGGYWQEIQKRGVLRCGVADAPPHVIRDAKTGTYSGTFVDLCREFAEKQLGVKAEMVDTTWDSIVAGLQAGRWDLALALNQNPKRAMAIAFSEPAWQFQITIVYDKSNPKMQPPPKSLDDVDKEGVTLAIVAGTAQDQTLTGLIKKATITRLPDVDATRLAVSTHRADALADDGDTDALFVATNPNRWVALAPAPAISKQGIAFGLRRDASWADVQALNFFITEKAATGEIQRIGQAYIDKLAVPAQ